MWLSKCWGVLFILVLVFGVLRPLLRNVAGAGKSKELALRERVGDAELGDLDDLDSGLAEDRVSLGGPPKHFYWPSPQ